MLELADIFGFIYEAAKEQAALYGISPRVVEIGRMVVITGMITGLVSLLPIFLVWMERKVSAHIQSRLGPMRVGFHGALQTIADGIKLFLKEDIVPREADRWVHRLAPLVVVVPTIMAFAIVPFGSRLVAVDLNIGILYFLSVSSLGVVGIIMAGWGSNNKYTLLGGLRSAAQIVSYEIPRALSILPVVMLAGSLQMSAIVSFQELKWFGFLPRWFIFYPVVGQIAFLIFLTASIAECNRTPFDLPEAESELVAGFSTEYSGLKFAFFFMAEFANMFLGSAIATALFLGGGSGPVLPSTFWFLAKTLFLVFLFMLIRWTFPRLRVDRLMTFNWKVLLPWCFVNIFLASFIVLN